MDRRQAHRPRLRRHRDHRAAIEADDRGRRRVDAAQVDRHPRRGRWPAEVAIERSAVAARERHVARAPEGDVITRRELASALSRRGIADWVLIERDQEHASIDERLRTRRVEKRLLWQVTVHVDTPQGRGSAHTTIDAVDGLASAVIDQTIALAQNSLGPAWIQRPLAAPARVKLEDLSVAKLPVLDVAADIAKKLKRTGDVTARV